MVDVETISKLHEVLSLLKSLTNTFENTRTPHFKAFRLLENAIDALDELESEKMNPFPASIKEELMKYTINPSDCGMDAIIPLDASWSKRFQSPHKQGNINSKA